MATLMIRNLDEEVKRRLRVRGAAHGRSMEAEARAILAAGVLSPTDASVESGSAGAFDHLVGVWKGRMSTDELMAQTRGD